MTKQRWFNILILICIVSIIPLYLVGLFDHPSTDDYFYATETAAVWSQTHSIGAVIGKAFSLTRETYLGRQGNYIAVFFMFMTPALWGGNAYAITPVLLLTVWAASMLFFFVTVLRSWLHAKTRTAFSISLCITFTALQMTYRPSDSFYWYNGGFYYTFFFSMMLVLFALVSIILKGRKHSTRLAAMIFALPVVCFIGGGNFATSLFTMLVILVLIISYSIFHSDRFENALHTTQARSTLPTLREIQFRRLGLIAILFVGLISFAIAVFAPGNAVRQESVGGHTSLLKTFLYSFAYGGYNIASSTSVPVLVMWLVLLPLFYRLAKESDYQFRYPLLVLLFTYGIFCAQGTPVFYAQGLRIPYRMMNIIHFAYYPFMAFNLIYLMGWIARKTEAKPGILLSRIEHCYDRAKTRNIILIVATLLFIIGCIGRITITETEDGSGKASFTNMPLTVSASYTLISGQAARYDAENVERDAILRNAAAAAEADSSIGTVLEPDYLIELNDIEVTIPAFSVTPEPIFHSDLTEDATHWKNTHLEMFYHIRSIVTE